MESEDILEQLRNLDSLFELEFYKILKLLKEVGENLHHFDFEELFPVLSKLLHTMLDKFGIEVDQEIITYIVCVFGETENKRVLEDLSFLYNWEPPNYDFAIDDIDDDILYVSRLAALNAAAQLINDGGKVIVLRALEDRHFEVYRVAAEVCAKHKIKEAIPILLADRYNIYGTREFEEKKFYDDILCLLDLTMDDEMTRYICDLLYDENFDFNNYKKFKEIILPKLNKEQVRKLFKEYIEIDILQKTFFERTNFLDDFDEALLTFKHYKLVGIINQDDIDKMFIKEVEKEKAKNMLEKIKVNLVDS